ncbi:sensor histidine kinase [Neobacillus mesonae]|uniref:histidine kinase n=1 Tax=Neobacillus mesonae TaxID=1193713 RepID=A0A3T0I4M9_9BACI|nr:sensor histidine kinase [Neobacillus mesonae]AZU64324.1 histidine kinase [Neobacillus mesonae]
MFFRIRTKLLLYFSIFVILLIAFTFFLYKGSEKIVSEYDKSFEKFLLLNDISKQTNRVMEKLNAYINDKDPHYLIEYELEKKILLRQQKRIQPELMDGTTNPMILNYDKMIDSFLEESVLTVDQFQKEQINLYSAHLNEATKISQFIQESTLSILNNELTSYQDFYKRMSSQNHYFKLMGLSLFCTTILLSVLLAVLLSGGITKPITRLSLAAREIASGNFAGDQVKLTTNDELGLLTKTFNQMRENIRGLVDEIKEQSELDQLLKEMELKSLQSQINPHFLFNTLNIVSKMAFLEDAHQTSRLIESISTLLRYNLGDLNKSSTLRDEVKVVKEYFFIQQTRFSDRIHFTTRIDESCLSIPIPSLTLQPIVENAFVHGIEEYEAGAELSLLVYREENCVIVEVIDNGIGMEEVTKERLLAFTQGLEEEGSFQANAKGHSTGIGVKNVIRRLQLFYRKQDVVEIHSKLGDGTTFRLKLPIEEDVTC